MNPKLCRLLGGLIVGGALAAGLAACGDGDDEDDGGVTATVPTAAATTAATAAATPDAEPTSTNGGATEPAGSGVENVSITAADFSLTADADSVAPDSVVQVAFTNTGAAPHTVTFYTDSEFSDPIPGASSGRVSGGGSQNFTFEAPEDGSAFFRCEVHPDQMQGELTVE